jgi:Transposase DDE domain group 1
MAQEEISPRASLVVIGQRFQQMGIWTMVEKNIAIKQKVLLHTPLDKLKDCLINILAGGTGVVETNLRVRPDRAVQVAFGRKTCAEQSTISDTLNACSAENVSQMRTAIKEILRCYGSSYQHPYDTKWQLLDVDVTGMPAGRHGEGVTKGYFAGTKNRRGRQLGRVLASWYDEVVTDKLYNGKRQLDTNLPELVEEAETALDLDENKRQRTILRVDGGGGKDANINWMLKRQYHVLVKAKNWHRAAKLAATVTRWYPDPKMSDREVGWATQLHIYAQPTRQLVLRKRKQNGKWSFHALIFTLTDLMLFELLGQPIPACLTDEQILMAALHFYDLRGGGLETQNKGDKQGLGLSRRNKHRFAAQEMLVLLAQLAHNLIIWTRNDLAHADPHFRKYGILRTVRDVFHIPGSIQMTEQGTIGQITLNAHHPLAPAFLHSFLNHLARDDLSLILGKN